MNTHSDKKSFWDYFSYDNAPHWVNVFIHIGFGFAILSALIVMIMALMGSSL
ncbi:MAG: hypothetical protein G3M70_10110 [Candidatus Nitronauta litoralis]|uniref:Uncharacterized protein n=1 Tax=Candidatus Nitronauta litoralis TaxID=2705533 RepID=A0A7T0G0E4_9BACT|nr:MAG: hypothetical protein G3M70_10110 [Candidatus Nitronauta litoralis]